MPTVIAEAYGCRGLSKRPAAGQPESPSSPGPDRTGPKPVRGRGTCIFKNTFGSGRVGSWNLFRVGDIFYRDIEHFSRYFGDKLES